MRQAIFAGWQGLYPSMPRRWRDARVPRGIVAVKAFAEGRGRGARLALKPRLASLASRSDALPASRPARVLLESFCPAIAAALALVRACARARARVTRPRVHNIPLIYPPRGMMFWLVVMFRYAKINPSEGADTEVG
jgi:hypothetical protein